MGGGGETARGGDGGCKRGDFRSGDKGLAFSPKRTFSRSSFGAFFAFAFAAACAFCMRSRSERSESRALSFFAPGLLAALRAARTLEVLEHLVPVRELRLQLR